jgi:hypothetical protein
LLSEGQTLASGSLLLLPFDLQRDGSLDADQPPLLGVAGSDQRRADEFNEMG